MPNTTHGLPYPNPTDPVASGAANIQALAAAVESMLFTNAATPPAAPLDGQLWRDSSMGWLFRYNAGSASASKWEFIGGPPARAFNQTGVGGLTSQAYTSLGAASRLTVPRAGDYYWWLSAVVTGSVLGAFTYIAAATGATPAQDALSVVFFAATANTQGDTISGGPHLATVGANALFDAQGHVTSGQALIINIILSVLPLRVS